jgi:hypothetical protein
MKVAGANKSPEATLLVNNKYADDPEEEVWVMTSESS